MYERRVHIRVPVGVEGNYQPIGKLAVPKLGMTKDISLGGSRFASAERLEPGGKYLVALSLPKEGQITLTGVVVWSREAANSDQGGYEAGFCWANVDPHAQARLNSFLTDYTRVDSVVIFSGPPLKQPVNLVRAAALALIIFGILSVCGQMWLNQMQLVSENKYLRAALNLYQQHQMPSRPATRAPASTDTSTD